MENTPTYKAHKKTIRALELIMMGVKNYKMDARQKKAHDLLGKFCFKIGFEELAQQEQA